MLLAIDTSTAQVGLALYDGIQILGEMTWTTRQHPGHCPGARDRTGPRVRRGVRLLHLSRDRP